MDIINIYKEIPNQYTEKELSEAVTASSRVLKEWRKILRKYNIKLLVKRGTDEGGSATVKTRTIYVNIDELNVHRLIIVILHEISHFLNYYNNKFYVYHHYTEYKNLTSEDVLKVRRSAWLAEMYTDKVAKKLCSILYPNINYINSYSKKHKKWILKYYMFNKDMV